MKVITCDQGSAAWFSARLGKPTASHFAEIVTPLGVATKGAKPRQYSLELLAERLTGLPTQTFVTAAMERGTELEPRARAWYEMATGIDVKQVGFLLSDNGGWGCSPDGLCADRGIEIKCPGDTKFLDICESGKLPDEHMLQCQCGLWLTQLPRWDYVLFTDRPGLAPQIIHVLPNTALHAAFAQILPAFCDALDAAEKRLRAQGHGVKHNQEQENEQDIFNSFGIAD